MTILIFGFKDRFNYRLNGTDGKSDGKVVGQKMAFGDSCNSITHLHACISDKLGLEPDAGRGKVRQIMKRLEKDGKVIIEKKTVKEKGARKQYVYRLKENV